MAFLEVEVSAPGKVILHGEHSVLYGQLAIAGSLGLRTSIIIKEIESSEPIINLNLPSVHLTYNLPLETVKDQLFETNSQTSWNSPQTLDHENHLAKIDQRLPSICPNIGQLNSVQRNSIRAFLYMLSGIFEDGNLLDKSLDVRIVSGLSVGAGTGSSASFAVSLAGALIQLLKLKCGERDEEFGLEDKLLISVWAFNCEKIMHGSPSGIDNTTCTFGSLVGFRKGDEPKLPTFQAKLRILLVDTKVSRETKALVAKVAKLRERNSKAVDCVMEACGHIAVTAYEIIEELSASDSEDTEAHYKHLSELWNMNHCLLSSLGVSHPSLESVCVSAHAHGLACKLTGAGGGGFAIVLIPPTTQESTVESVIKDLEAKGFAVRETLLGGPGVLLDRT